MVLNLKKTKSMIINFTKHHQFATGIKVDLEIIETVPEVKLLETIITYDIKWEINTDYLTKKAWKRMQLLYNAAKFT